MNNYSDVITLVDTVVASDGTETTTNTDVFAAVSSVGCNEFYTATQQGIKPEIKFIIADYDDYDLQAEVLWNSKKYRIIRTYRNKQELEIVCERVNA